MEWSGDVLRQCFHTFVCRHIPCRAACSAAALELRVGGRHSTLMASFLRFRFRRPTALALRPQHVGSRGMESDSPKYSRIPIEFVGDPPELDEPKGYDNQDPLGDVNQSPRVADTPDSRNSVRHGLEKRREESEEGREAGGDAEAATVLREFSPGFVQYPGTEI